MKEQNCECECHINGYRYTKIIYSPSNTLVINKGDEIISQSPCCECIGIANKSEIEELKERIESLEKNHHLNYIEERFNELYKLIDEQVKFTFNLPNKPYHELKERIEILENNIKNPLITSVPWIGNSVKVQFVNGQWEAANLDKAKVKKYYVNVYKEDLYNTRLGILIHKTFDSAAKSGSQMSDYIKTISFIISEDELK